MKTNRDLYLHARSIGDASSGTPLRDYLRALRALASHERATPLGLERVAKLLEAAQSASPDAPVVTGGPLAPGYAAVDAILAHQIGDLTEMTASGQIDDPYAYFGIDAPSGARWYNLNVAGYLECAARGSVGGYTEDEVIVLIPPAPGESADSEVDDLTDFGWEVFEDFLICGRCYE
jgi:hypothetical protein